MTRVPSTLPEAVPPKLTLVMLVSHSMLKPAGMRIRMSFVALMRGVPLLSVMVIVSATSAGEPTVKLWWAAEEILKSAMAMLLLSSSTALPRLSTSSSR